MACKKSVSVCLIVKNEEDFLETALTSARCVLMADDIVVVDTGSTDTTKEIAEKLGANVFDFEWCDDFSAAKNFAAAKAANDWILALDADEELMSADLECLAALLSDELTVGVCSFLELSTKSSSPLSRLYNRKNYMFKNSIHEQIEPIIGSVQKKTKDVPILIVHHGYISTEERVHGKLERNERLLKRELEKHPDDPYLLFQLGKSFFYNDRDLQLACDYFAKALSSSPDVRLEYVYNTVECYGYALINTEQYEKALELLDRYLEHYGNKPQFRFLTGHILQNNAMLIEAVEFYESCIGADITDYSGITSYLSYYNIGVILECVDMIEDAIGMYKECGDYEPAEKRLAELTKKAGDG